MVPPPRARRWWRGRVAVAPTSGGLATGNGRPAERATTGGVDRRAGDLPPADRATVGPAAIRDGSVDDGKSTLIGRLLYDSKQVLSDQLEHVAQTSGRMGTTSSTSHC